MTATIVAQSAEATQPTAPLTTLQRLMQGVRPAQGAPDGPEPWKQHSPLCRCLLCR